MWVREALQLEGPDEGSDAWGELEQLDERGKPAVNAGDRETVVPDGREPGTANEPAGRQRLAVVVEEVDSVVAQLVREREHHGRHSML